ncbi:unnamed protein product [Arctogadus glacialis]
MVKGDGCYQEEEEEEGEEEDVDEGDVTVNVVDYQCTNFLAWSSGHSVTKLKKVPNLSGMAIIQLRRGSRSMFIKMAHDEVEYTECDFLMKKVTLEYPGQLRPGDKGVEREKKMDIIAKICPMVPPHRRHFWENLAEEE